MNCGSPLVLHDNPWSFNPIESHTDESTGGPSLSRVISADRIGMDRMIADDFGDSPALGWLWLLGCLLILIDPWNCWTWHLETFKTQFPCSQVALIEVRTSGSGYQWLSAAITEFHHTFYNTCTQSYSYYRIKIIMHYIHHMYYIVLHNQDDQTCTVE